MKKNLLMAVALSLLNFTPAQAELREYFACVGNSTGAFWRGSYQIRDLPRGLAEVEYCAWQGEALPLGRGQVQRQQQAQVIPQWLRTECVTQFVTTPTPQDYLEYHAQQYLQRHYPCENRMAFGERFNPQRQQQPQQEIQPQRMTD